MAQIILCNLHVTFETKTFNINCYKRFITSITCHINDLMKEKKH